MPAPDSILAILHLFLLAPLCVLGLHKAWMIFLWWRRRKGPRPITKVSVAIHLPPAARRSDTAARRSDTAARRSDTASDDEASASEWPRVTVQLPLFNERFVVARLLDAVAALDYPRSRFEIQVLDDSTDDTAARIARKLSELPADLEVHHIRRERRVGYKAGALAHGLETATGELIAIFDADFIPPAAFLRETVGQFADDKVGMVQARWDHTNRGYSLLTQVQALLLDGHFAIEQKARANNACFFNFNGTAGIFRRACIEAAGGWQHDTLTEDMDLSYRAQLEGWRFVYLPELACPAELPIDMSGFLTQQHRWAKGSIQTGRKLFGRILRTRLPWLTKFESVFHLFGNFAFPLLLGVVLIALPLQLTRFLHGIDLGESLAWIEGLPLLLATVSVLGYYGISQLALRNFDRWTLFRLPLVLVLGAGSSLNNTLAVFSAMGKDPGEFKRTPKFDQHLGKDKRRGRSYHSPRGSLPAFEVLLAIWAGTTLYLAAIQGQWLSAAFHGLFAAGFLWVGIRSWLDNRRFLRMVPVALLASCIGGTSSNNKPIIVIDSDPEIVACQALIGDEFGRTEIVYSTRHGLAFDDLPSRSGMELGVRVHPDGKRVVFSRERSKNMPTSREIFIASIDGSVQDTRLTGNIWTDDGPCWSPDGTAILFAAAPSGDRDLYKMDAAGENLTQLTTGAFDDADPDWHAAGIVFSRFDPTTQRARLFRTDATGAAPTALTDGGAGAAGTGDFEPAWSPDGKSILFVRAIAPTNQILMRLDIGNPVPVPIGDGGGEDRFPRWSPRGDRIFVARSRPALGLAGLRLSSLDPADPGGGDPLLVYPELRFAYLGFDPTPAMAAYPARASTDTIAEVGSGVLSLRLGAQSRGAESYVLERDDRSLGIATQPFDGREVAGILLTLNLPVTDVRRIAALRIEVTGAITRTDPDSYFRLALRNFSRERYDAILEVAPVDTELHTWSFATSSLAHVDRGGQIRLEVIGDVSSGERAELLVDHIGVKVRLLAD